MATTKGGIQIVAIPGSVRAGNFTSKALALAIDELHRDHDVQVSVFDPSQSPLLFPGQAGDGANAEALRALVTRATGVMLATPEYHGSYSSVIKLVIENLGFPSVLAGKPIALLGVAAGRIGAIKAVEHLRGVCAHIGGIVLPGAVSVALVQQAFDAQGKCTDPAAEQAVRSVAKNLIDYIRGAVCPRVTLEELARQGSTRA